MPGAAAAPIIVTALLGDADFAWLDGLRRRHFPAARNQVSAHLTLFHHLPPSLAPELDRRLRGETRGVPSPVARLAGLIDLGGGVAFRVESDDLARIRDDLAQAFDPLLIPQDRAGWRPHVTVQNKVLAEEAKALLRDLTADFRARPLVIAGLASWSWLGGPWQRIGTYRFRA